MAVFENQELLQIESNKTMDSCILFISSSSSRTCNEFVIQVYLFVCCVNLRTPVTLLKGLLIL